MRFPEAPEQLRGQIQNVLEQGTEVGLRCSIISGPTHEDAMEAAQALSQGIVPDFDDRASEERFANQSDAVSINALHRKDASRGPMECLWSGLVPSHGPAAIALVGSPTEIASAIVNYKKIGISQFILSGWPKLESMVFFSREILPLIREREDAASSTVGLVPAIGLTS